MSVKLHVFANHLLSLPDTEVEAEVCVMERNEGAPEGTKPFAARVKFFTQCETQEEAAAFALLDWKGQ